MELRIPKLRRGSYFPKRSLEDQIAQTKARLEALQGKEMARRKAKDTRRKILLGEFVLRHLNDGSRDAAFSQQLLDHLRKEIPKLARKTDAALFDDLLEASPVPLPTAVEQTTHAAASAPTGAEAATQIPAAGFDGESPAALTGELSHG